MYVTSNGIKSRKSVRFLLTNENEKPKISESHNQNQKPFLQCEALLCHKQFSLDSFHRWPRFSPFFLEIVVPRLKAHIIGVSGEG